jgi:hypothetical protein
LRLRPPDGTLADMESFDAFDVFDAITLSDTRASLELSGGPPATAAHLLVDSARYGVAGFGAGKVSAPGSEAMGLQPSPFIWTVDPETGAPEDGTPAVSFVIDSGQVMGLEPSPFRALAVSGPDVLGELDFSGVSGGLGSLHLEGIQLVLADGSSLDVGPFDVVDAQDCTCAALEAAAVDAVCEGLQTSIPRSKDDARARAVDLIEQVIADHVAETGCSPEELGDCTPELLAVLFPGWD